MSGTGNPFEIREVRDPDRAWVRDALRKRWGAEVVVSRGRVHQADRLPGFAAWRADAPIGLLTYCVDGAQCEVVTLDAFVEHRGIGTALLQAAVGAARAAGCRRLWLVTTNDNLAAVAFYERRGMRRVATHRGAVDFARRLKPTIPLVGHGGVPIHDEMELELPLDPDR